MGESNILSIENLSFCYGEKKIIDNVSFQVRSGEFIVLVGSSGCGKSTLLRLIAGLEQPTAGEIKIAPPASTHGTPLAYLFQDYDSFPWLTVWENVIKGSVASPLKNLDFATQLLEEVGLWAHRQKYPAELSGGMRKRLGLARALVRKPAVLLLDEPFSSLDVAIRGDMYLLVQRLAQEVGCTIILVSHDIHEMLLLGERLLLCSLAPMQLMGEITNQLPHPRVEDILDHPFYRQAHRRLIHHLETSLIPMGENKKRLKKQTIAKHF